MLNQLFRHLAPVSCFGCDAYAGGVLCEGCIEDLILEVVPACYRCNKLADFGKTCRSCRSSSNLFSVYRLSYYEGLIKQLILSMKYDANREAAELLGRLIADRMPDQKYDVICYVPTASSRIRYRGFDHAKLIAVSVSKYKQARFVDCLLRDKGNRQVGASRLQRQRQIANSFSVSCDLSGQTVLLIDDVISTGSTIEEAAKTLRILANAKRVLVAVAAHNR